LGDAMSDPMPAPAALREELLKEAAKRGCAMGGLPSCSDVTGVVARWCNWCVHSALAASASPPPSEKLAVLSPLDPVERREDCCGQCRTMTWCVYYGKCLSSNVAPVASPPPAPREPEWTPAIANLREWLTTQLLRNGPSADNDNYEAARLTVGEVRLVLSLLPAGDERAMRHDDAGEAKSLLSAAHNADWGQVVLNQGPPCFHLENDRFCLRAERWPGHGKKPTDVHAFVSFFGLIASLTKAAR
jgi:hypothetical protein